MILKKYYSSRESIGGSGIIVSVKGWGKDAATSSGCSASNAERRLETNTESRPWVRSLSVIPPVDL